MKTVEEAQKDLDDFIESHPRGQEMQWSIEESLKLCANSEARQMIILERMADNMARLADKWDAITEIAKDINKRLDVKL